MPRNNKSTKRNQSKRSRTQNSRVPRGPTLTTVYRFRRSTSLLLGFNTNKGFTSSSGSVLYGNGMSLYFTLNDVWLTGSLGPQSTYTVPSVVEFISLFDRYRINNVNVRIIPSMNTMEATSTAIGTTPATGLPIIQTAVDYDDATPPVSASDLLQRTDLKVMRMDRETKLSVVPRFADMVDGAAGVTAGHTSTGWLTTSGNGQNTRHYGRKFWAEPLTGGPGVQQGIFVMYVEYDMSFDMPR